MHLPVQAQAPKLRAEILELEAHLRGIYGDAIAKDYTLWATGPEAALEMIQVSDA